jgi:hypothetical protein
MQTHNTPIAAWHSQPFEVPVLDNGMRWAFIFYRNPIEQPRQFSFLRNIFIVREGQNFGAIGNEDCTIIRVWQFRWWISWPNSKKIKLTIRKLTERRFPEINTTEHIPLVNTVIASVIVQSFTPMESTPHMAIHVQPHLAVNITNYKLALNTITDEPTLKSFHDTL